MRYRSFGKTGWQVSEIGFGAWQIGGTWGAVDDNASIRTLHYAWNKGINFVDTAELYGEGHSETVIGQALKSWNGEKIYVATKVRPTQWPDPTDDAPAFRGRFPDWYLREKVEGSLKRLGVERIDLLQLHSWSSLAAYELDWLETLNDLRIEGKIDQIGISLRDNRPGEGVLPAKLGLVASQQAIFNLFEQTPATELLPTAHETQTAFIARVPLDSGSLVGNWHEGTYQGWEDGSQRKQMFRADRFAETLQRVNALKNDVLPFYETLAEAAMKYILAHNAVSVVIPGMSTPEEVEMNLVYSDGSTFPEELAGKLPTHAWVRNYYS